MNTLIDTTSINLFADKLNTIINKTFPYIKNGFDEYAHYIATIAAINLSINIGIFLGSLISFIYMFNRNEKKEDAWDKLTFLNVSILIVGILTVISFIFLLSDMTNYISTIINTKMYIIEFILKKG